MFIFRLVFIHTENGGMKSHLWVLIHPLLSLILSVSVSWTCVCVCVCVHDNVCRCMQMCACAYTCAYTCVHIDIYVHMHVEVRSHPWMCSSGAFQLVFRDRFSHWLVTWKQGRPRIHLPLPPQYHQDYKCMQSHLACGVEAGGLNSGPSVRTASILLNELSPQSCCMDLGFSYQVCICLSWLYVINSSYILSL